MTENSLVLFGSFIFFIGYWVSYLLIRPHVRRWNKYGKMLVVNMFATVLFFMTIGIYLARRFEIGSPIYWVNLVALNVGLILHHLSVMDHKDFSYKVHHQVSHLLFFIPFTIFSIIGFKKIVKVKCPAFLYSNTYKQFIEPNFVKD